MLSDPGSDDDDLNIPFADPFPMVGELAERFGQGGGQKVYLFPQSVRYRWLDLGLNKEGTPFAS